MKKQILIVWLLAVAALSGCASWFVSDSKVRPQDDDLGGVVETDSEFAIAVMSSYPHELVKVYEQSAEKLRDGEFESPDAAFAWLASAHRAATAKAFRETRKQEGHVIADEDWDSVREQLADLHARWAEELQQVLSPK